MRPAGTWKQNPATLTLLRGYIMKVNKMIKKLHRTILQRDNELEKKYWFKLLKKSLKHKNTQAVR